MGWFTNRNKSWEVKHTLILLGVIGGTSFLSLGVLTPLVVVLFGSNVKMGHWTRTSLFISSIYLFFLVLALFVFAIGENPVSLLTLNYISFYIYVVYFAIYVPEYLQRLDLKNYIHLEKNREYSYFSILDQLELAESRIPLKDTFIANMERFKQQITSKGILVEIDEITRLINVIGLHESNVDSRLLERHISTIENALIQYIELSARYLQNDKVTESKKRLEELVKYARIALENELTVLIEAQVLHRDGESSVYLSVLKGRGFV